MTAATEERGFTFPATLELSAMGAADAALHEIVPQVLAAAGLAVVAGSLRSRASSAGRYVSITVAFHCPDRASYDAAHRELRAHPAVKWTL
ncbi:MAG: DUF493 family protein [Xanthomonadales bacterium]|nr:DUF493 family protein [Xanthomonadales bacterium]